MLYLSLYAQNTEIDSLTRTLHWTETPSEKLTILIQLAAQHSTDKSSLSKNYADQALFIAESINDMKGRATAFYYLAQAAIHRQDWEQALNLLTNARNEFEKQRDQYWVAKVDISIGLYFQRKLEYEKSLTAYYNALDIFRNVKNNKDMAEAFYVIGSNFYEQGNLEKALEYYTTSLNVYEIIGDSSGIGLVYCHIGEIYRLRQNYSESQSYLTRAEVLGRKLVKPIILIESNRNLGRLMIDLEVYDSAKYFLDAAGLLCLTAGKTYLLPQVRVAQGTLNMRSGEYDESLSKYTEAYDLAVQLSDMIGVRDASKGLSEINAALHDYQKAYNYHLIHKQISDSISSIRIAEKVARIEMQNLYDQQLKSDIVRRQKTWMNFITIALIVLLVIVFIASHYGRLKIKTKHVQTIAYNLQLEHLKLKDEIDQKNRVLTTNVMYMVRKNELIGYISDRLAGFMDNFKDENKEKIREIILNLRSNIDKDIWNVFEKRFSDVHGNFFKTLQDNFPQLTEKEKKLCALLRLNLTTKEIAAITHQNVNAIEVARTRLRNKLNLSNTDINLNSFLASL
jgi:tetratricopeptide (TPR) repeat protein